MPAYVVYGRVVFATTTQRNKVATKATTAANSAGFTPSSRVPGTPGGVTSYNFIAPADSMDPAMPPGSQFPAVMFALEHPDQATVAQAELLIQDEINAQGVLYGDYGTWTDFSASIIKGK